MAVVVVTGCSTGFGLETALAFARRGDRVFATMRNVAKADALLAAAQGEGLEVDVVALDVNDEASVRDGVASILATAGAIDVLVNNAGIGSRAAVECFDDQTIRDVFETNVFGVLRMLRAVLPGMRERGAGAVVNVSSMAGRVAVPFNALYCASKHALEAFSEALALEIEPFGVRVALIEPGYFRTSIGENVTARSNLDPASPYAAVERLALDAVATSVEGGGDPRIVAEVIVEAATTDRPRLRWPVGADAERIITAHRTLSDDDWTATLRASIPRPA
jgi:NAD(P)-dependent dehydrogenase (short-subunit alcohol dehydrogenase family)